MTLINPIWVITGIFAFPTSSLTADSPPNVVFFLVDDLGATDLGCYGSTFYDTPSIDRLAEQGVRLTRCYAACPVCSPTRASILTGRYPPRTGITDYIGAAQPANWKRNTKHLPAPYAEQLALEEMTLPEILKSAGYATFFAGKWHLGGDGFLPEDQGFDFNFGGLAKGGPYGGKKYFSPYDNPKLPDGPDGEHLPDRLANEAVRFMTEHRDKPFLVYFPFYDVHTPLMARDDLKTKYEARRAALMEVDQLGDEPPRKVRLSQDHAVYGAMVEAMDQAVGKVLAALDELKLADNTLVIFTSDNGGLSTSEGSPTSNAPLRAGKGWLYEGGIRTPAIVRWPAKIAARTKCHTQIISPDYLPTILEAAEIQLPPGLQVDGQSFLDELALSSTWGLSRPIFWHYPHYGNQGGAPCAAVLDGGWKLIEWLDDGRVELFHLRDDPSETTNLALAKPERVQKLRDLLHAWQHEVNAVMTTPNPAWDPAGHDGRQ